MDKPHPSSVRKYVNYYLDGLAKSVSVEANCNRLAEQWAVWKLEKAGHKVEYYDDSRPACGFEPRLDYRMARIYRTTQ